MKTYLITALSFFLFSIVVNAGTPNYASSNPNGLTTYPSTYPSPLTSVTTGSDFVVTFSENIKANTSGTAILLTITSGTSTVIYESKNSAFYLQGNSTPTSLVKVVGRNLTVNFNNAVIQKDVLITVKIDVGFVKSTLTSTNCPLINLRYKGITPSQISILPLHNAINVVPSPTIQMTFNSYVMMNLGSSSYFFTIYNQTDNTVFWTTNSSDPGYNFTKVSSNIVSLTGVPPFTLGKTYRIYYDTGFFTDGQSYLVPGVTNGNWEFSVDALYASSLSPLNGAIDLPSNEPLVLTFNTPVTLNSGNATIYNLTTSTPLATIPYTGANIDGTNMIITLPHVDFDFGSTYCIYIDAGFVKKISNNALFAGFQSDTDWQFSIKLGNIWEGTVSSDVTDNLNWLGGYDPSMPIIVNLGNPNNPVIGSNFSTSNVTIRSNGALTINNGATLTLSGSLTLESDANDNGSLLINGGISVASNSVFIQQYANESDPATSRKKGYSSPVSPITGDDLGLYNTVKKYVNQNQAYVDVPNTEPWVVGMGYASYIDQPITFTGALNTATSYSLPFTFTANPTPAPPAVGTSAYNFYGNPYTAAIDWPTMWADSAAYLPGNAPYRSSCWILKESTQWAEINGATGVVTNGYTNNPVIPRGHAFMLRAWPGTNTNITMKKTHLVGNTASYLKSMSVPTVPKILRIEARNAIDFKYKSEIVVGELDNALVGIDTYDTEKYSYPVTSDLKTPQIVTYLSTGEKLAQNIVPTSNSLNCDIAYYVKEEGGYCIRVTEIDPTFSDINSAVMLTDNEDGITVSLKDSMYCFYSSPTVSPSKNRFTLSVTTNSTPTVIIDLSEAKIKAAVSYSSSNINITLTNDNLQRIEVYNINGSKVFSQEVQGTKATIPFEGSGVYVVKVIGDKSSSSHKIVVTR